MLIYIDTPSGRTTEVCLKPSDTVGDLKVRIEEEVWISKDRQRLTYRNDKLDDGYTFESYGIEEGATIRLLMDKVFSISIQPTATSWIPLEVNGNEIIGNLKFRLQDGELISRDRWPDELLIFDGMRLEDGRSLSDYNIQEDAIIYLPGQFGAAFPIHIRFPTGETELIFIEGMNTIRDLKSRLQAWLPPDTIPQLIFHEQELEDKKLVFDYNIQRESTVDLQLPLHLHAPISNWITASINIIIKTLTGKRILFCVKGTDNIDNLKSRIEAMEGIPFDQQRLIFGGWELRDTRWTIFEYGIPRDATIYLLLRLRGGGGHSDTQKKLLGLVDIAQAISLWDWDGIMPGPGNNTSGLRLSKGEAVTVGRIVNDEWYQGFNINNICGYFPRAFVSVRKIDSSGFKDDIHVDDTPIEDLHIDAINEPSVKAASKRHPIVPSFRIISKLFPSTRPHPNLARPDRPDLPPSPVPAPPAFDRIVDGNRVLVQFSLDPKDNQKNYTLRATLSLNSAPGARFSGLTFNVNLADGTILAISPENVVGPETEAEVTKEKSRKVSLSTSLQAGSAPVSASIGASACFTRAEHITFIRKTRGTIQGNGVGSSKAYWVMKEDDGPAAEQGLGPVFDLMLKLNVRPAIISFQFVAYILCKSGTKAIQSGILDTSV